MMKIAWLTENYPPSKGGMAQSCDRLVTQFRNRGHHVDLLHFTHRKPPFKTEAQVRGTYTALPKTNDMAHGLQLALNYVEHHLSPSDWDCLLVFGGLLPITAAPIYSKLWNTPMFICLRGNDFDLSLFNVKRRSALYDAITQSRGVFAVSHDKVRRVRTLFPEATVAYTPNGIDTEDWYKLQSEVHFAEQWRTGQIAENKKVIGIFGFLKEKKGVLFFLKALIKSGVQDRILLLFSGEQEEGIIAFLEQHHINYITLPFLDRIELIKYYLACDWVAIPSFYEGMPNVMLEAGALGKPVLATAIDGMKDVLEQHRTGLLFRPMDESDCAQCIYQITTMSSEQQQHMGNALAKEIKDHYSAEKEIDNYLCLLQELLPEPNNQL